jgi:hypothetical protein
MVDRQPSIGDSSCPPHGAGKHRRHRPPGSVAQLALPPAARTLSTLTRLDYTDAFLVEVTPDQEHTGEQWARATLEGAPSAVRGLLRLGWLSLGLMLEPPRAERSVLGWEIRESNPEFALLGVKSRTGMPAELLFKPEGEALLFATFVQLRNRTMRTIWTGVAPPHRRVVPYLLRRAARSQTRS